MQYLEWSFDEDVGIEPDTPLGRIAINGEEGTFVEDKLYRGSTAKISFNGAL